MWIGLATVKHPEEESVLKRSGLTILVTLGLLASTMQPSSAAAGALDRTYSGDGITTTLFGTGEHVVVDAQQRVIVGGQVQPGRIDAGRPSLMRFTNNGALDRSLDGDGRMSLPIVGRVRGLGLQSGKIVVATERAVWRLNPDGTRDATFGGDGRVDLPAGRRVTGRHPLVVVGSTVFILVSVQGSPGTHLAGVTADARYRAASTPARLPAALTSIAAYQGRMYAVGSVDDGEGARRVVVVRFRLSPALSFDGAYGGSGAAWGPPIVYDADGVVTSYEPNDLAVHATSGTVTVVGSKYDCHGGDCSSYYYGFALRFTAAARLDRAFGNRGEARAGCTNGGTGMTTVLLQGNKTIAAGESYDKWEDAVSRFGVTRLNSNGSVDPTFSRDACYNLDYTDGAVVEDASLVGGKLVAAGGPFTARYLLS